MKQIVLKAFTTLTFVFGVSTHVSALIVNSPISITHQVTVQMIKTAETDGDPLAEMFGGGAAQATIFGHIDTIWAQAGIDINFLPTVTTYNNDFAFRGTSPRPQSDLDAIIAAGDLAGVGNSDPNIIDLYFVEVVPGSEFTSENTANGLAKLGANGIAMFVGSNLLAFDLGLEVIASVAAHEIGHNLGLPHLDPALNDENLMCGFPFNCSISEGELLNASQVTLAQASPFAVALVPIPAAVWMFGCAMVMLIGVRRQQAAVA